MKSKPTLALLHGWGMNTRVFDTLHAPLASHCSLLPLPLPGHGRADLLRVNTLSTWATHIADRLPPHSVLLGWSLGGQLAMRIAYDHPTIIRRLILISTTPKFVADACWQAGMTSEDLLTFGAAMQADPGVTLSRFLRLQTRGAPMQKALLQSLRASFFAEPLPESSALAAGLKMLLHTDLSTEATQLAQPTTVIHGNLDKLTPPAAGEWLAKNIPLAKYYSIDGAAHAPFLSHAEPVVEAMSEALHD